MGLELEVRKFTNSDHIGDFVTVTLPGELPVRHDEIRTVRRDRAAAERAAREAEQREDAEKQALERVHALEVELKNAREALKAADAEVEACTKKHEELLPDYTLKKEAMEAARREYGEKKAESDRLEALMNAAEAKLAGARKAVEDAQARAAAEKAALEKAGVDGKAAETEAAELEKQYQAAQAEFKAISEAAAASASAAEDALHREEECERAFTELNERSVSLSVEKRVLERQLEEAQAAESRAEKDHQKAKDEHEAAEKQYEALKASAKKRESEKDAMRLAQAKSRLDTAEADVGVRLANFEKERSFLQLTRDKLSLCERSIAETSAKLTEASAELEKARKLTRETGEKKMQDGLRLSEKKTALDSVFEKLSNARERAQAAAKAAEDSAAAIKTAEAESETGKPLIETADDEARDAKRTYEQAKAVTDTHEVQLAKKRSEFDAASKKTDDAQRGLSGAISRQKELTERIGELENRLTDARNKLEDAQENSRSASSEAKRLTDSIHVIETKYETAKMHFLESGRGEPIILIHTAGQSLYTFRRLFYKLAMSYHVFAVDLMGHGYSDRPDFFDYGICDHAESIARFMDAVNIESAHLIGFSMGAGMALTLAKMHPDRVGRVVAISPGGITGSMPLSVRMIDSMLLGPLASRLYRVRSVEKMLHDCVFDHTVIGEHDVLEYFKPASDPDGRYAIRRTVSGFDEDELTAAMREIEAPVMIVWGREDKWHPVEMSKLYRAALPSAALTIVPNAGHLVHEEKPDRLYELVRSFIPAGYGVDD